MSAMRCAIVLVLFALLAVVPAQASPPRPVTIDTNGHLTGPSTSAGSWQAHGAFNDSGTYTESFRFAGGSAAMPRTIHTEKTLVGADGTLHLRAEGVVIWLSPTLATFKAGNWRITSGTGAYLRLHAGGTPGVTADSFGDLVTGVVDVEHAGRAH
jgi:hypothetical protein